MNSEFSEPEGKSCSADLVVWRYPRQRGEQVAGGFLPHLSDITDSLLMRTDEVAQSLPVLGRAGPAKGCLVLQSGCFLFFLLGHSLYQVWTFSNWPLLSGHSLLAVLNFNRSKRLALFHKLVWQHAANLYWWFCLAFFFPFSPHWLWEWGVVSLPGWNMSLEVVFHTLIPSWYITHSTFEVTLDEIFFTRKHAFHRQYLSLLKHPSSCSCLHNR